MVVIPDRVHNQMGGNLITGTSRALVEEVTFNTSQVTSLDWVTYPIAPLQGRAEGHATTSSSCTTSQP